MENSILLAGAAAFLTAVLSGLGLGSAGLFVLYLTLIAGLSQTDAQGLNLLFFLFSAGMALIFHARHRTIPLPFVLFLISCALPGAYLGSWLVKQLELDLVRKLFGGMLICTALPALLGKTSFRQSFRAKQAMEKEQSKKL